MAIYNTETRNNLSTISPPEPGPGTPAPSYLQFRRPAPTGTTQTTAPMQAPAEVATDTVVRPPTQPVPAPQPVAPAPEPVVRPPAPAATAPAGAAAPAGGSVVQPQVSVSAPSPIDPSQAMAGVQTFGSRTDPITLANGQYTFPNGHVASQQIIDQLGGPEAAWQAMNQMVSLGDHRADALQPGGPQIQPPVPGQPDMSGGLSGGQPVPLTGLGGLIERLLGTPSPMATEAFQKSLEFGKGEIAQQSEEAKQRAIADAASRGMFFGTPLSSGLGRVEEAGTRALGDLTTRLLQQQASTQGADMQRAIQSAMQFGGQQMSADQFAAQLALQQMGLGMQGAPDINAILGMLAGQPLPGGGGGTGDVGAMLGQILGGQGGQPQTAGTPPITPPAPAPTFPTGAPLPTPQLDVSGTPQPQIRAPVDDFSQRMR